ncbi:MAG TPA: cysteine--tRNA ligase [Chloroflexota bacterium]
MSVRMYSTLTGREDDLVPTHPDGVLRMYVCGMTPKFHPHVGHARLFVAMDVIRRYLLFRGYRLKFVQNFTDVDDKIIVRAANEGRSAEATAQEYIASYFEVMDRLNVCRADEYPTVTGYMERIIEFIAGLVEAGHGYVSDVGDVWFEVSSFPDYGKLSHRDLNSQLVAARKELEPGKRDPRDFALWKHAREGEPSWPSPWGHGRPGWHIECSAMVRETLGDQIDIHGGGADLIFPHHENEIAQSESLTGVAPFAWHWAHVGLVILGGGDEGAIAGESAGASVGANVGANVGAKMAHSAENFTTLASMLERYTPLEVRYFLLATHYRSSLTFALDVDPGDARPRVRGIEEAHSALGRLRRALGDEPLDTDAPLDMSHPSVQAFTAAMDADFNTPDALAVIFDLAREINTLRAQRGILAALSSGGADDQPAARQVEIDRDRRTLDGLLRVLGLDLRSEAPSEERPIDAYVDLLLDIRARLRDIKQWALADEIRTRLADLGVSVEDQPGGRSIWRLER